jgi:hypothetical protein
MQIYNIDKETIELLYEMVKNSSYVKNNTHYMNIVNATQLRYSEDPTINAYATRLNEGSDKYGIQMYKGLCSCMQACSVAFANYIDTRDIDDLKKHLNKLTRIITKSDYKFIQNDYVEYILDMKMELGEEQFSKIVTSTASYASGAVLEVLGHELGHICLGHLYDEHKSLEVSRNNERQADLFACSVVNTTLFKDYVYLGSFMSNLLFTWMGKGSKSIATTHPHGQERLDNMFNAYEYQLAEMGISREVYEQIKL